MLLFMPTFHKDMMTYMYIPSELRAFLTHVTGKITVAKMSIQVSFMEATQAIAAHTCTGQLASVFSWHTGII